MGAVFVSVNDQDRSRPVILRCAQNDSDDGSL